MVYPAYLHVKKNPSLEILTMCAWSTATPRYLNHPNPAKLI
jgi:hypothetical protein